MPRPTDALAEAIDALLPQTQCRLCGYAGCRPYAEAVAAGEAGIDQCPPGGDEGATRLAELLELPPKPVDRRYGIPGPPLAAWIDEARCIGCTLCIQACPVDAIVGASRLMHTVITRECTGCGLCLPPCPVECIVMRASPARPEPRHARALFEARARRLRRAHEAPAARAEAQAAADAQRKKHETIARAVARARARLERHPRR